MKGYLLNALKRCIVILLFRNFPQKPAHSIGSEIGMCHLVLCFKQKWESHALNLTAVNVWRDILGKGRVGAQMTYLDIIFSAKRSVVLDLFREL